MTAVSISFSIQMVDIKNNKQENRPTKYVCDANFYSVNNIGLLVKSFERVKFEIVGKIMKTSIFVSIEVDFISFQ